ncbi:MAG: hypothetical protein L0027_16465 [Candidatus Rokubacteria bacterium]|nr:hypothetical protein [Candidatus Rokubacteria bacterium]
MTLPAGYAAFCEFLGLNPHHPEDWGADDRALVDRWRLGQFRARWRWLQAMGHPDRVRRQTGRAALIAEVRAELAEALAPLPTAPWRGRCPCHPVRLGRIRDAEPWLALREAQPFVYGEAGKGELALAWLEEAGR